MRYFLAALIYFIGASVEGNTAEIDVTPAQDLQAVINSAPENVVINLHSGRHLANLKINQPITLNCYNGANIDAGHKGDAIRVYAADVTIQNCQIVNWGDDLTAMNAGIFAEKSAVRLAVLNNQMSGDTFGIWLDAPPDVVIQNNRIQGNPKIRSQDRGNGIHLFNVTGAKVQGNEIWNTRDGIYIDTSNHNELTDNHIHNLRYGIHYMYSHSNLVAGNYTHNTRTGYALMQSKMLTVVNNRSHNDSNYGILMNFISQSTISRNQVTAIHQQQGAGGQQLVKGGEGKAIFIYNAPFNQIDNNYFANSEIAIHLTAGSEQNKIFANHFVANQRQVKYVGTTPVEWSYQQQGNFWSDYQGWDRDLDGIGDEAFEPNDSIDKLLWKYPAANLLINSPATQTLRWVEKAFPVLKSPGIKDSYPLMQNTFELTE